MHYIQLISYIPLIPLKQSQGWGPTSLGLLERDNMYDITTFNFNTMAHVFYNA